MEVTNVGVNELQEKDGKDTNEAPSLEKRDEETPVAVDDSAKQEKVGDQNENEDENGDKDDNEFVVWADDAEEMEEDKKGGEDGSDAPKVKKEFGIEMSKDTDELLVTWNGKELKVPCKEEVSRDLRYYSRQLHLIAYPICFADLEDPALNSCLKRAINLAMEIHEAHDGPPVKGYLRMKFNSLVEVREVREALAALPAFPKSKSDEAPTTTTTTTTETPTTTTTAADVTTTTTNVAATTTDSVATTTTATTVGDGGGEKVAEAVVEKSDKVDESGDKKDEKSGGDGDVKGETGDGEKKSDAVKSGKRDITIVVYSDHTSEGHLMSKIKGSVPSRDAMASRLLYVANIGLEITELELSDHFTGNERVIIPTRDNKSKG